MTELTDAFPRGASPWERDLYAYLSSHGAREGNMLEEYVRAADESDSKALAYVIALLVEDERRHHRLFADLASSLKTDAELGGAAPVIPHLDFQKSDRAAVLEVTKRLIDNEEGDAAELKRLRRDLRVHEDTTLWALLVDTMMLDTAKHLMLLRFVEHHSRPPRR